MRRFQARLARRQRPARLSERARRLVARAGEAVTIRSTAGPRPFVSTGTTKTYPERERTKEPGAQQVPEVSLALAMSGSGRKDWTPAQRRRYRKNLHRAERRAS